MKLLWLQVIIYISLSTILLAKDYRGHRDVKIFINQMVKRYGYSRYELNNLFSNIKYQKKALAVYLPHLRPKIKYKKRKKKIGSWDHYKSIIVTKSKFPKGVEYLHKNRYILQRAYRKYGVPPEYITAIIGIESHYGYNAGRYPVLDTLTTLSFEKNRRNRFFKSELRAFLLMTKREKIDPRAVKGSYAGAIGLGQFMPSNYKIYVVDFNGDGKKRMNNTQDAIGSVAYYLKRHGWKKDQPVATRVSYKGKRYNSKKTGYKYKYSRSSLKDIKPKGEFNYRGKVHLIRLKRTEYDELWYGTKNFYVITRYNHSSYYAMGVHQLAQGIKMRYNKKYGDILR